MTLNQAKKYFAQSYCGGVVGSTLEDGYRMADIVAGNFERRATSGQYPEYVIADYLFSAAYEYEVM